MASFGDSSLRNVGSYIARNGSLTNAIDAIGRAVSRYQAKYIVCKNAKLTPFWHIVGFCMVVNYAIEYPHLKSTLFLLLWTAVFSISCNCLPESKSLLAVFFSFLKGKLSTFSIHCLLNSEH